MMSKKTKHINTKLVRDQFAVHIRQQEFYMFWQIACSASATLWRYRNCIIIVIIIIIITCQSKFGIRCLKVHEFDLKMLLNVASNPMDCLCIWEVINIADYDVCFSRLMSQLADVNIQPSVGMLALYDVLRCCCYWTNVFSLLYTSCHSMSNIDWFSEQFHCRTAQDILQ